MTNLAADPLQIGGICGFGQNLRAGAITASRVTKTYLDRIAALNPKFNAYIYVNEEQALEAAEGIDRLVSSGTDLGPLMGVPVAVKDLFSVHSMPTGAGSNLDLSDCLEPEGRFIRALKRAGCIIVGKTRTVEFAAGAHNLIHPTPWNPCDHDEKRSPGGSSHGSAVAVAAGLCGFAVGTDTGGSVRVPAALCGIAGLKTSYGLWPLDGVFPLCPTMDSVGLLTKSADEAALVYSALEGDSHITTADLRGMRLGVPQPDCLADLETPVAESYRFALRQLQGKGAELIAVSWPPPSERAAINDIFAGLVPSDLLATLGVERFRQNRNSIDPVALKRLDGAEGLPATEYIRLQRLRAQMAKQTTQRIADAGVEAIVSPTTSVVAPTVAEINDVASADAFVRNCLRDARAANVYDNCAATVPIKWTQAKFPVGLQIACAAGCEAHLLSLAKAVEPML